MVSLRRFGPLIGLFLLAVTVLTARLWDVQVREHETWAREAANLVRSWFIEPYSRGRLLDAEGRVLARDEESYELEFVWRDFRRGHPLGQVAALRSLAVGRPVSLEETRLHLETWAEEFTRLSPADIDAFGRGEELVLGPLEVPAVDASGRAARRIAREERRGARAGDLDFYVKALLHPSTAARRRLPRSRGDEGWTRPYLELIAEAEGLASTQHLVVRLRGELAASLEHLDRLASEVHFEEQELPRGIADLAAPRDRLVALIEDTRREVEADIADDLFRRAAGFDPTRLSAANLTRLDLTWLRRALVWDEGRLASWREDRGEAWSRAIEKHLPAYAISRSKLGDPDRTWPEDRVLSALAYAFSGERVRTLPRSAEPQPWWEVDDLVVLADLVGHLAEGATLRTEVDEVVLPFQDPALASGSVPGNGDRLRRAFAGVTFRAPERVPRNRSHDPFEYAIETCLLVSEKQHVREWRPGEDEPFAAVLEAWDGRLQARIAELLDRLPQPVALDEAWVDQALKARRYVVRDRGARPVRIGSRPPYDLVRLVTRYPARYSGFTVRAVTERRALEFLDANVAPGEPLVPVAGDLLGRVRPPALLNLLQQRPEELELAELQRKLELLERDRDKIVEYAGASWQEGTSTGGSGLEAFLDPALRGRNGYRESTGLQDRRAGNRAPIYEEPVDGEDVRLTLDIALQRAAQLLLEDPGPPPEYEDTPDRVWHEHPVGALCLVSVEGDVIVAASGPSFPGYEPGPGVFDDQRSLAIERTLRQHGFQPPGSVIKPFVAAWALERGWITPQTRGNCVNRGDDLGAHRDGETVRCHGVHGKLELHGALTSSCNAYFAAIGEEVYSTDEMRAMARAFGFDSPTGVAELGDAADSARGRIPEDWRSTAKLWRQDEVQASRYMLGCVANGLIYVTATPLQVARAYAALATGDVPRLRIVDRVGEVVVPHASTPLPLSAASLTTVRGMLADVPISGTARNKGLDRETLGFALACKTGSADFQPGRVPVNPLGPIVTNVESEAWEDGMRKHGWVAGWFPVDRPRYVVVAYVHDTSTTSSHVATHLLSRFLTLPEVRGWLAERGVGDVR